jgi:MFS transporter, DHA1 family, solute carrier family 18 (vesicular amine transporter), member 1/2
VLFVLRGLLACERLAMALESSRTAVLAIVILATFTDIVAYSIAVPVLPDLSRKLGASPTTIGLLFASFGVTLLSVSIPMGAASDRIGRKGPLVAGLAGLAAATLLFAFANSLPGLFAARLAQGAADAVAWVVGLALLADVYEPSERGWATGIVMSGSSFAFMIGPSLGGWLYEIGGIRLPFIIVAVMAATAGIGAARLNLPDRQAEAEPIPVASIVRLPDVGACAAAVIVAAATISMLEPVLALQLESLGVNPGRVGIVFGVAALASAGLHPVGGRLADRFGARQLTLWGLVIFAAVLPILGLTWNFESAIVFYVIQAAAMALVIAPSVAYMGDAVSAAGIGSFGVAYGLYNVAWGAGLLGGPALGGFLFERLGFGPLTLAWAPAVVMATLLIARVGTTPNPRRAPADVGL